MSLMNDVLRELDARGLREGDRTETTGAPPPEKRRLRGAVAWVPLLLLGVGLAGIGFIVARHPDPGDGTPAFADPTASSQRPATADEDAPPARRARLRAARVEPLPNGARLHIALDRAVVHAVDRIDATRVVLRLPDAELAPAARQPSLGHGPVVALEWREEPEELRAILDFDAPIDVEAVMAERPDGADLVLHLARRGGNRTSGPPGEPEPDEASDDRLVELEVSGDFPEVDAIYEVPAALGPQEDLAPEPAGPESGLISVRRSQSPAESAYREGRELDRLGRTRPAREKLTFALELEPAHERARERLARLMIREGDWSEAVRLLADGRRLDPDHIPFAELEARVLVEGGFLREAVEVLESVVAPIESHPEHHAFLAALMQRRGDHARAAKLYASVLQLQPEQASWWLGLGISLEAEGRPSSAHASFERAVSVGGLDEASRRFARERMRALDGGPR